MHIKNLNGWVVLEDLRLPEQGGIRVEYLDAGAGRWRPACIFPRIDEESLFRPSDCFSRHRATVLEGQAPARDIRQNRVFWNHFVNLRRHAAVRVRLRVTVFDPGGKRPKVHEEAVGIDPSGVVFLDNWRDWRGGGGWVVERNYEKQAYLTIKGKKKTSPLCYEPGITGTYDVFVGIKDFANFRMELPGIPFPLKVFLNSRMMPVNKSWKEVFVATCLFAKDSRITLLQAPGTAINPLLDTGGLDYIKLAPVVRKRAQRPRVKSRRREIAFYGEPESLAYYGDLQNERMAETLVREYKDLGVDKMICQVGRGGSRVVYPSRVVRRARTGPAVGDDQQSSNGIEEMTANMDILKVLCRLCRREGIHLSANMGINACYAGTAAESLFSAEHPEYHLADYPGHLDFSIPEVREFFSRIMKELAAYDLSGLSIDYCRYHFGQTAETLIALHRQMKDMIGADKWKDLEILVRIPVDTPEYFQAFEAWCREDLVDIVVPSNQVSCYPKINLDPYRETARGFKKSIYGCIDSGTFRYADLMLCPRPDEVKRLARYYYAHGADGLFFYQSEAILDNIFLRRVIPGLR